MTDTPNQQTAEAARPTVRRLTRRTDGKMIAGVAAGLGEYFRVDPVWFRLGFVLATLLGGAGLIAYGAMWLIIPVGTDQEPTPLERHAERIAQSMHGAPAWVGVGLLVLGSLLFVSQIVDWRPGVLWGIALILLGIMLFRGWEGRSSATPRPAPPAVPPAGFDMDVSPVPPGLPSTEPVAPSPPPVKRRRSRLGLMTIGALMFVLGIFAALDAGGAIDVALVQYLSLALAVLGIGMGIGAWWGRARWLIFPCLLLIPFVLAASLIKVPFEGGMGNRYFHPAAAQAIESPYRLAAGDLVIDLRGTKFGPSPVAITATNVAGRILVRVPAGIVLDVRARTGAGEVNLFGRTYDGFNLDVNRTFGTATPAAPASVLRLDLEASYGLVEVRP